MKTKWDEYVDMLQNLNAQKRKHPGVDLTWPFLMDGTPIPPKPRQEREEATKWGLHLSCKRPDCRRHHRCAFVSKDARGRKRSAVEVGEKCRVFGTGSEAAEGWSRHQMGRLLDYL